MDRVFFLHPENRTFASGRRAIPKRPSLILLLLLVTTLPLGALPAYLSMNELFLIRALEARGVPAAGQVEKKYIEDDGESETHVVRVAFRVPNHGRVELRVTVDRATYVATTTGDTVAVRYLPEDPASARAAIDNEPGLVFPAAFAAFWSLVAGAAIIDVARKRARAGRLASGRRIEGRLVSCTSDTDSDGDYTLTINYGFTSPKSGRWIAGTDKTLRNDLKELPLPARDSPILVLYQSDKEHMVL